MRSSRTRRSAAEILVRRSARPSSTRSAAKSSPRRRSWPRRPRSAPGPSVRSTTRFCASAGSISAASFSRSSVAGLVAELITRFLLRRPVRFLHARQSESVPVQLMLLTLATVVELLPVLAFAAVAIFVTPLTEPAARTRGVAGVLIATTVWARGFLAHRAHGAAVAARAASLSARRRDAHLPLYLDAPLRLLRGLWLCDLGLRLVFQCARRDRGAADAQRRVGAGGSRHRLRAAKSRAGRAVAARRRARRRNPLARAAQPSRRELARSRHRLCHRHVRRLCAERRGRLRDFAARDRAQPRGDFRRRDPGAFQRAPPAPQLRRLARSQGALPAARGARQSLYRGDHRHDDRGDLYPCRGGAARGLGHQRFHLARRSRAAAERAQHRLAIDRADRRVGALGMLQRDDRAQARRHRSWPGARARAPCCRCCAAR